MRSTNRVMLIGRIGRDPEIRTGSGGQPWGTFSLATGRYRREGEAWIEETDWHWVKVFGKEAERAGKVCAKGALVAVEGTLVYEKWTDREGRAHEAARIHADRVSFLASPRAPGAPEEEREEEEGEAAEA